MNSGIYSIKFVGSTKQYIGSAVNLEIRKRRHFNALKAGKHPNKYLQNAANKYGILNFSFEVYEIVNDLKELVNREQFYLDLYKENGLYNIRIHAKSNIGLKHSDESKLKMGHKFTQEQKDAMSKLKIGSKVSKETKEKISKSLKGKKKSEDQKAKISLSLLGRKHSDETRQKMSKSASKRKRIMQ